ncbi:hypothetical protein N658DRAFT_473368 [Parathielavia hyrcaniae]|uniref:Zn(2)-C6 fungal-type domain-containing protein n=1 Tax=Parathielavia hyrcaniae TaxID=113614 RepID=A0AAN6T1C0_9PEZI|nr:hypothetical protein N658DRAFT_473368 [Parathielavia hyrcaniae]
MDLRDCKFSCFQKQQFCLCFAMETRSMRTRVANACDLCKLRKIKCSGVQPCGYCVRRGQPGSCRYTAPRRRPRPRQDHATPNYHETHTPSHNPTPTPSHPAPAVTAASPSVSVSAAAPAGPPQQPGDTVFAALEEHEETEVPREARLLCDAQGKLVFIGDCAPLSFFQTVRRLVTTRVDANAFAPESGGYTALENVYSRSGASASFGADPPAVSVPIAPAVSAYLDVTAGLIDLFDNARLVDDIASWAELHARPRGEVFDVASAVHYLVLAIGSQKSDEHAAQLYFDYARNLAFASLSGNLGVASVQAFILITFFSLGACQINGAFLFFGVAARAAYSIGIHRTAVNARFGPAVHRQRDRLWKSLRVLDLFLSTSMGRPPATSDVDCTVPYRDRAASPQQDGGPGREALDLLNASAQIFLVTEAIVLEVYSRRKISPRLTEGISRELRDWSARWLHRLSEVVDGTSAEVQHVQQQQQPGMMANGACQILASYYYAVILVSRPFLMVELHRRLAEGGSVAGAAGLSGKSKLADACIDAAILMIEPVRSLIERGLMTRRAPVVVSWLFASSLVLGVGLLGGFGRIIEKHCRYSIAALEYFAQADAHAVQYSLIAKSLLSTALQYLEKREVQERQRRTESSSLLFGLIPRSSHGTADDDRVRSLSGSHQNTKASEVGSKADKARLGDGEELPQYGLDFESAFFGLPGTTSTSTSTLPNTPDFSFMGGGGPLDAADVEQTFGALNLFPLLETDGHIDLANYF